MRIPLAALELIEESSVLKSSKDRLYLAQLMGSVVHHAERLLGEATFDFRLAQHETNTQDVDFPTSQEAYLRIRVPKRDCHLVISVKLPRPLLFMEQAVLLAISAAHHAAMETIGDSVSHTDVIDSFLDNIDALVIDTAISLLIRETCNWQITPEVVGEIRGFLESLMTTTYEGQAPEIGLIVVRSKKREKAGALRVRVEELLESKKTAALFVGHRHLLLCNCRGEIKRPITLKPYPDVNLAPRRGYLYLAPYEYQPVLHFSSTHNALTFLLTRHREILVALGPDIIFGKTGRGWRLFGAQRFVDVLEELLWENSKRRLPKKYSRMLAIHLGMLCLSLRQRGKGGLFVICQRGMVPSRVGSRDRSPDSQVEAFYQDMLRTRDVMDVPVSLMCNTAGVDGATVMRWDGAVERFGLIVNTENWKGKSEGARTQAAEYMSHYGIAIKISEDGPIVVFKKGVSVTAIQ